MNGELGDVVQLVGDEVGIGAAGTGDADQHRVELPLAQRLLDEAALLRHVLEAAGKPAGEDGQAGRRLQTGDIDLLLLRLILALDGPQRVHDELLEQLPLEQRVEVVLIALLGTGLEQPRQAARLRCMADRGRLGGTLELVDVDRGAEDVVGIDVAQCPCHAAITALLLGRFELVLVAFDQQLEELAAGVALGIPLDAQVQHGAGQVDADQPVGEALQIHALGEFLQARQGDGDYVVLRPLERLFQLDLHAVGRDVAGPAEPGPAIVLDGDGGLVDVASLLAQLDIVQRLDLEGGGTAVVTEALQLVGVVLAAGVELELFPLAVEADLLQQTDVAYLLEPLLQQHVLQLGALLALLTGQIGLVQVAAFQTELVDPPAGATGPHLEEERHQAALQQLLPGGGEEVEVAAHRVGKAVDQGLFQFSLRRQQGLHAGGREQAGEHVAVLGVAPILQDVLVVLGAQGDLEAGTVARAEEQRHAGHARQVELLIPLDDGRGEQVVDADPVAALVALDEIVQKLVEGRVLASLDQPEPVFPLFALFPEDLVADRMVQDGVGVIPLQPGEEHLDLSAGLVVGQIGHRNPDPAQREIGTLGEQLVAIGELDHHGGAEVHPLLAPAIVAGKGDGIDIVLAKRADGRLELAVVLAMLVFLPVLQRFVDPQGVVILVEIALRLEQADGLGRHEMGDPFELVHQALIAQLVAHVDDPAAGGAFAFELHLDQKTAVAVLVLGQAIEDVIEILFSEQRNKLFNQVLLLF